ncbi:unnamed protein product, partial [Rotaria sp. Silwood2]
ASILSNGKVLIAGGYGNSGYLNSAELYDLSTGVWTKIGNMSVERYAPAASRLPNGKILITGGYTFSGQTNSAELYA